MLWFAFCDATFLRNAIERATTKQKKLSLQNKLNIFIQNSMQLVHVKGLHKVDALTIMPLGLPVSLSFNVFVKQIVIIVIYQLMYVVSITD